MKGNCYSVLLIDPAGNAPAEVAYQAQSREEAEAWVQAWEEEPLELVAVVWPKWAALPQPGAFATAIASANLAEAPPLLHVE
jgi:hypothetical protein